MKDNSFSAAADKFFDAQISEWKLAHDNFEALKGVESREIEVDGTVVRVQFNPARIVSSGAKVDAETIKKRKCFLCAENRPAEQRELPWGDNYLILVNPFPIFPRHLTIPDRRHTDQKIEGRIADMVSLAADLKGYTVFYNGPKCGASAPDHMHFQAGNSDFLPLSGMLETADLQPLIVEPDGEAVLSVALNLPMNMFVIDATDADAAQRLFDRLTSAMTVNEDDTEPMMNVLCYVAEEGEARVVIIPRKRHRPSFYGTEGEGCMLISPASVDLGGVFITPREADFKRIDSTIINKIYEELCLNNDEISEIIDRL